MTKDLLQVYILTGDQTRPNKDYLRIFTTEKGFAEPIFMATQYPPQNWIQLCDDESTIQLYNQYLVWVQAVQQQKPMVILDNGSFPVESDCITSKLILEGAKKEEADIVYYGKYLDDCRRYNYRSSVILTDGEKEYDFSLFQTWSPHGAFAYVIQPEGAAKIIREMSKSPNNTSNLLNNLIEKNIITAWVYHPSIIRIWNSSDERYGYECREPAISTNCTTWGSLIWYIFIVIIIAILIGVLIYSISASIVYKPDQEISSGF